MPRYALHCSHEQIPPSRLLQSIAHAEQAGFQGGMSSDHFAPWSERQGESGFAWSFLGAALARTQLPFGVVNAPGQRYHPAIIAQAAATLCEMFPERLWIALGSGEAANEHITGGGWPRKALEALWTPAIEILLGKRRIMEIYLNIAETGRGIFGVESAAQRYYGKSAAALSAHEAAGIAAILPKPRDWSPNRGYAARRVPVLLRRMRSIAPLAACITQMK